MSWAKKLLDAARGKLGRRKPSLEGTAAEKDLVCFFIPEKSRGWILEAVCREIATRLQEPYTFCHNYKSMPQASAYFFCHYHFYLSAVRINPELANKNCIVWFTHPKDENLGGPENVKALQNATIVTMASHWREYVIAQGLKPEQVVCIVGAADPDLFKPHDRGGGKIGFCTAFYERKMPDRILEIVQHLPQYDFLLLGRNWSEYPRFQELCSLENFEYLEAKYSDYPAFYRQLDVFVSASQLEGGPIPLLESMMSNVVPVASDTGFARDLIQDSVNGYLFSATEQDCGVIAERIERAKSLKTDIRQSVLNFNWDSYSAAHAELFRKA